MMRQKETGIYLLTYIVNAIAAGRTKVPIKSIKTTNCMEKQKVPQRSLTRTSSMRLWIVELIHLRLWESNTLNSSGTVVLHTACGTKTCFLFGKVFNIKVER